MSLIVKTFITVFLIILVTAMASASEADWKICSYNALNAQEFGHAIDLYYLETGMLPPSQSSIPKLLVGRYLKKLPVDSWGNHYIYNKKSDTEYELKSYGKNGKPGGEGYHADFSISDDKEAYIKGCKSFFWWVPSPP